MATQAFKLRIGIGVRISQFLIPYQCIAAVGLQWWRSTDQIHRARLVVFAATMTVPRWNGSSSLCHGDRQSLKVGLGVSEILDFWDAMATVATIPVLVPGPSDSARPQGVLLSLKMRLQGEYLGGSVGGERRCAVTIRSQPWRGACRALKPNPDDIAMPPPAFVADQPQVFYFAAANAESLMLEGAPLESVLQDGIERAERAKRPRDVWLIMEPAFLNQHPGLKALKAQLSKPTAAILSTNADWMLSFVKKSLPQAVIGKFISPSTAVPDPLKSNLNANSEVVGGGGVWH